MGGKQTEARLKDSRDNWKDKSKAKSLLIKSQKKEIVELRASRELWRSRYYELVKGKKNDRVKVGRHSYDGKTIWLCVWLQLMGKLSFRGGRQVVVALGLYLGVKLRIPSASSIRIWVCKYGYFSYTSPKDTSASWALIVDESVVIGQERFLLILGVDINKWKFEKALCGSDVEVLGLSIAKSWKSEQISKEIENLRKCYQIAYVISDEGNNLQATWKKQGLKSISDCTHLWAKSLEKIYKEEVDYIHFCQGVTALRKRWILSKNAALLPPALRAKSRFHQVFQYVDWSIKIKENWHKLNEEQRQELCIIDTYQNLLFEWEILQKLVAKLNKILKIKGLSNDSIQQTRQLMLEDLPDTSRLTSFKKLVENYLNIHQCRIEQNQTYLCCSDIIESIFGTYKQTIAHGSDSITELVLALAGLGKNFNPLDIKNAMEAIKVKDIAQWKQENTTPSLAKNKRVFFTKYGGKI